MEYVAPLCIGSKVAQSIYDKNGAPVCIVDSMGEVRREQEDVMARRIVACVNKFSGISTADIEDLPADVPTLLARLSERSRQCDQLLAALESALSALDGAQGNINPERGFADEVEQEVTVAISKAKAAIGDVKGGAA